MEKAKNKIIETEKLDGFYQLRVNTGKRKKLVKAYGSGLAYELRRYMDVLLGKKK